MPSESLWFRLVFTDRRVKVNIRSVYTLECLVNLCGSDWFTDRRVKVNIRNVYTLECQLIFVV